MPSSFQTCVVVDDVDTYYARAKALVLKSFDIKTQDYGGRDYTAKTSKAMSGPSALTTPG